MLSLVVELIVFHLQVESIVLSIISMLSSPNDESPANIEAAVSSDNLLYTVLFTDLYLWDSINIKILHVCILLSVLP